MHPIWLLQPSTSVLISKLLLHPRWIRLFEDPNIILVMSINLRESPILLQIVPIQTRPIFQIFDIQTLPGFMRKSWRTNKVFVNELRTIPVIYWNLLFVLLSVVSNRQWFGNWNSQIRFPEAKLKPKFTASGALDSQSPIAKPKWVVLVLFLTPPMKISAKGNFSFSNFEPKKK